MPDSAHHSARHSARRFAHLHVHTEYSLLDGAARLSDLVRAVGDLGMNAVAMTDHGNLHGLYDFFTQATAAGITPVLGIEAYVAPEHRSVQKPVRWGSLAQKRDDVSGAGAYTHMTIWAYNATGLHNLFRLQSRAALEGHFRKPRVDRELLAEHAEGLMATTGCPSGEVATRIRLGQQAEAFRAAGELQEIFGKDDFFVELMDHGIEIDRRARAGLEEIAGRLNAPYVVTNDSHYTYEREATAHSALLCVQTASKLEAPAFRFDGSGYFIKSPEQMYTIDSSDAWQSGCRNTALIAQRVDTTGMFEKKDLLPRFPVPAGHTEESWFREEVWRGLARRFPRGRFPGGQEDAYRERAEYEMDVIARMGFPSYFLVVADFIMWAKERGIAVGPGRGSAAGALVAYALGITDLDPIPHGLIFERFLNPERVSMPDIDVDFDERRRGEVIQYVTDRWGADRVAQIVTFGVIKAKAAVKDACRILGHPYALGDRITKAMPADLGGKGIPLSGITDASHPRHAEAAEVRALYENEPDVRSVVDTARGIEGLIRQTGVHAAGVIMAAEPLTEHIPVFMRPQDGAVITQFDYPTCETLGLLKMDFLGLRNLTIMDDAVKAIGTGLDLLSLPLDDRPTYELFARGDTLGVFQFDGAAMRSLMRLMKPDEFADITAVNALYRPGPMGMNSHVNYALRKNGQQEITPIHPEVEEPLRDILGETYGLVVYQEQVQLAAQKLAGYSLGQADLLRRAMGKKKKEILDKEFVPFREGCRERGYSDEAVQAVWDVLVPFAGYAFNKAHAAAYALVSYWTAYLKANHPAEYMAAVLTSVRDDKDKMALYLGECRRMNLQVLPPDVNESAAGFAARGDGRIRFGLAAVRNVGANVVESISATRTAKGRYRSFPDFLDKSEAVVCNKRTIESLIKAGAFDSLGHTRKGLAERHEQAVDAVIGVKRSQAYGQDDLFGLGAADAEGDPAFKLGLEFSAEEWDKPYRLAQERDMLGLYVSDHPLLGLEGFLRSRTDHPVATLTGDDRLADGTIVTIGGIISGIQRKMTKQGRPWAIATVEDLAGSIDCLFFPSAYLLAGAALAADRIVLVKGRLDKREDVPRLVAMELEVPEPPDAAAAAVLTITLAESRVNQPLVRRLKEILLAHGGSTEVRIRLTMPAKSVLMSIDDRYRVTPSAALTSELKEAFGADVV
ncbi:DNA polymerase III subunit alpha [Actinomadura rudentiformis]|uniref:DNA polymerase III subunit alpha n=1 Tax=Actinomadura rudentiformis TaxID=359158 RepID=A0A6H9YR41_9ACTN|nr:DNA polymerase III subunit alpha [Actinomadura rudentiformis]KAB2345516.1 DNA polymerase III subunit alpha [Actinomadura rudentiformis]